ncbi:uncharacterized protein LAESUDRAFT_755497 [Laetiporus sulphureus 93-53]|uniref:Uncharacterized protein n=1 Tax=Laetiporus sulphureus 93-53 TaxID=1314785 RepID=A0A165GUS6_9APHY|nr:uncharacterized protein LAESUDRAFT_755497 [Laetiporus sulphureus 93-53]KZT10840.1 hypothetical protein LAESUDRAFT_755497 [Laetiporus sulphureus 93-53]
MKKSQPSKVTELRRSRRLMKKLERSLQASKDAVSSLPRADETIPSTCTGSGYPRLIAVSIRHIPADVLRLVFSEYLDIPDNAHRLHRATVLTMVCHTWRAIALDSAELWTEIKLSLDHSLPPLSTISAALSLSRQRPIDVYLRVDRHLEESDHAYWRRAIELVWEHQERWSSFDLDYLYDPYMPASSMDLKLQGTLPYLRFIKCKLQTYLNDRGYYQISISVHNFVAPRICNLSLGRLVNGVFKFTPTSLSHSFLSLESLLLDSRLVHFRRESRVEILRALACLPKLKVLQIIGNGWEGSLTTPSPPICLSSLRELTITSCGDSAIAEWLAIFRAPTLTTIVLPVCEMKMRGFDTFKQRFPSLHRMHFGVRYPMGSLTPYAKFSRYVSVIELKTSVSEYWSFRCLMQNLEQNGTHLFPLLHRLEIHFSRRLEEKSIDRYLIEALRNLVKTRSWKRASSRNNDLDTTGATLREVHIRTSGNMTPSLRKWFEEYLVCFTCSSTTLQDLQEETVRLVNGEEE